MIYTLRRFLKIKMNVSFLLVILISLVYSKEISAQLDEFFLSPEILFSDVKGHIISGAGRIPQPNDWKYYGGVRVGSNWNIWPDTLMIAMSLFYNERKALEFFSFKHTNSDLAPIGGISETTFGFIPTSPQSKNFFNDHIEYDHFPNFQYIHLEFLPIFMLKRKLIYQIGGGASLGVLLNRNRITFGKSNFQWAENLFTPIGPLDGEVRYRAFDVNWLLYFGVQKRLTDKVHLGITVRFMNSFNNLNDSESLRDLYTYEYWWLCFTTGIQVTHKI